jgi:small subunit ribosomal protein S2
MANSDTKEFLDAGVHFGHLKRKWHPKMAPYIFMEKNGIHIIDLNKTVVKLAEANAALAKIVQSGRKVLFVATKKQAKDVVASRIKEVNMPFVTERWPGGMLTNFATIRKAVRKMSSIDNMMQDGTYDVLSKRERLQITRQRAKLEKNLGSISELNRLPAALFIVDIKKEHIAVAEARKLNIPTFGIVDTNSDPTLVDFPIPANDDATKSIEKIMDKVVEALKEGLSNRKKDKEKLEETKTAKKESATKDNTTAEASAEKPAAAKSAPAKKPRIAAKAEPAAKAPTKAPAKAEPAKKTPAAAKAKTTTAKSSS